jgi:hypothetical protein
MEKQSGLIKGFECKYAKTDPVLIEAIAKRTEMPIERVKTMIRYNVFTVTQFADITGLAVSTITNKFRPLINKTTGNFETELDHCFPYPRKTDEGPKFVVRNEKAEAYIKI